MIWRTHFAGLITAVAIGTVTAMAAAAPASAGLRPIIITVSLSPGQVVTVTIDVPPSRIP